MIERRIARSRFTDVSLSRWLTAVAARAGASSLVVGDRDGLLVGAPIDDGGGSELAEELAALAAVDGSVETLERGAGGVPLFHGQPLTVRQLDFEGEILRVCAVGDPAAGRAAIEEAVTGITRILRDGGSP
jgi:hypothetical protein